ncbi:unnamed protein product [Hapterophycus canaliculatus]
MHSANFVGACLLFAFRTEGTAAAGCGEGWRYLTRYAGDTVVYEAQRNHVDGYSSLLGTRLCEKC